MKAKIKKTKFIDSHICGYNDGECVCKCFVSGVERTKRKVLKIVKQGWSSPELDELIKQI